MNLKPQGLLFLLLAAPLASCGTLSLFIPLPEQKMNEDKLYADIIGFSDEVTAIPALTEQNNFYHLSFKNAVFGELTQDELIPSIAQLPTGQNTAIYFALDEALDRIQMIQRNKPPNAFSTDPGTYYYTKYYVILFTDGLDNVSVQLARNEKKGSYANGDQYAAALRKRMGSVFNRTAAGFFGSFGKDETFREYLGPARRNTFEIFVLGLENPDFEENYTQEELRRLADSVAASYNAVIHDPIVSSDLDSIYEEFQRTFSASSFSFDIPKGFVQNKNRIRMEFAAKGEEGFPHWFEADIKKKYLFFGPYVLARIRTSPGFSFSGGKTIDEAPGTPKNSLTLRFTVNDLRVDNVPLPIVREQQLYYLDKGWRRNSEYRSARGANKNAYVLLLMDRSDSLTPSERKDAEDMVINIINLLSEI